jgi:hypothetical protein
MGSDNDIFLTCTLDPSNEIVAIQVRDSLVMYLNAHVAQLISDVFLSLDYSGRASGSAAKLVAGKVVNAATKLGGRLRLDAATKKKQYEEDVSHQENPLV